MGSSAFLWTEVIGAAALAYWFALNRPDLGPRSVRSALVVFAAGQAVPSLGLVVVRPAATLPHGLELVMVGIVLPSFVVMFVTTIWLIRAVTNPGHRVSRGVRSAARDA